MKKAILVNFSVTTRIVADIPEGMKVTDIPWSGEESKVLDFAKSKIASNPSGYMVPENSDYWEDTDMPAGADEPVNVEIKKL